MANLEYIGSISVVLAVNETFTIPTSEIWIYKPETYVNQGGYATFELMDNSNYKFVSNGYHKSMLVGGMKLKFVNSTTNNLTSIQAIRIKVV